MAAASRYRSRVAELPGVGGYTAAAVAAIAFGRRAVVVDANVERVVSRLFAVEDPLPASRPKLRALTDSITPDADCGDFAQAMMDLGSAICTPRAPACGACPLAGMCEARRQGDPERYPIKLAKRPRPRKQGHAYWLEQGGHVLLVRRPDKGMLGGMLALPSGAWSEQPERGDRCPGRHGLARGRRGRSRLHPFRAAAGAVVRRSPGPRCRRAVVGRSSP